MRKIMFLTVLVFLSFNTFSQNYMYLNNQFGVTNMNELNQQQLHIVFDQGEKLEKTGKALTIIGGIGTIVGGIMYANGLNNIVEDSYSDVNSNFNKSMAGLTVGCVFGTVLTVGIPIWITGNNRKSVAKVHLGKY